MKRDTDEWKLNFFPLTTSGLLFFISIKFISSFTHISCIVFFFNSMHAANFFVLFVKMKLIQLVRLGVCLHVDGELFPTLFFSSSMWTAGLVNRKGRKFNWRNGIILWNSTQVGRPSVWVLGKFQRVSISGSDTFNLPRWILQKRLIKRNPTVHKTWT